MKSSRPERLGVPWEMPPEAVGHPHQEADEALFSRLQRDHQAELLAHCYRMLGTLHDAEDALQEAWLKAWRRRGQPGAGSLRAWLYAIATNVCLDALRRHRRRLLPPSLRPASDGTEPPMVVSEPIWLGPFPDALLPTSEPGPEARYSLKESVSFAFLTTIQVLPPRQRATLLLRDVVGWPSREVASQLSTSVASVNSSLQRARARLRNATAFTPVQGAAFPGLAKVRNESEQTLLDRFLLAWESGDLDALARLLIEDLTVTMPPDALWFNSRNAFLTFLRSTLFGGDIAGRFRLLPILGNGLPGFAIYADCEAGFSPLSLLFLETAGDHIRALRGFVQPDLFHRFDVPAQLRPGYAAHR